MIKKANPKRINPVIGFLLFLTIAPLHAATYVPRPVQFYHPAFVLLEPRLAKDWLSSIDLEITRGSTKNALNNEGRHTPLFDIFGIQNLGALTEGIATNMNVPTNPFGSHDRLSVYGRFRFWQMTLTITQNISNGVYLTLLVPLRSLTVNSLCFSPLLATDTGSFFSFFDQLLAATHLTRRPFHTTGLSDTLLMVGHASSLVNTNHFDFIDIDLQAGTLLPTSRQRNENNIFSLPLGFDGHWAFLLAANAALGLYEWFTAGFYGNIFLFVPHHKRARIKTAADQDGFITLEKTATSRSKQPQCSVGAYIKADHFTRGLSLSGAYSYTYQGKTTVHACTNQSSSAIINSDNRLKRWYVHTIHGAIEYDFTHRTDTVGPRIGFFYDRPVGGRNIFLPSLWRGTVGIDISWCF